ncbi:fasciclin-like arabinogalactan protein 14 [Phoenix dactylifera]|uniref:Fasciclin-like arabinogalactan protein 14 n=1 Tax=Phoenix dactylifera TaxID=42345 RepID=A0A8B7BIK3_PHODC|nr:fasciclin-like arabinogalactan protein 14 [Phoenix dactylifera]
MASNPQTLLLIFPFLILSFVGAYNITQILEPYSSFSIFNNYLTQTKLADEINRHQTITVLVVDNSKMSVIFSYLNEILKHTMAIHVILDYYDINKLSHILHKSTLLTTLFLTSGIANNKLGILNVTNMPNDIVIFGSATPEAPLSSTFIKVVITKPYNISVLQMSNLIILPGIEGAKQASPLATLKKALALAPMAKPTNSTSHAPTTIEKSPASTPMEAPNMVDSPVAAPMDAPKAGALGAYDVPTTHFSASQNIVCGILGLLVGVIHLGAF